MHWPLFLSLTLCILKQIAKNLTWLDFPIEIRLFLVNRNIMSVYVIIVIIVLIIYITKLLDSDWLRAMQFFVNSAKKELIQCKSS